MLVSMVENKRVALLVRAEAIPVWIQVTDVGFPDIPSLAMIKESFLGTSFNRTAFANYAVVGEGGRLLGTPDCRQYNYHDPLSLQPTMTEMLGRQLEAIREARRTGGKALQSLEERAREVTKWCSDPAVVTVLAMAGHTPVKWDQHLELIAGKELAPSARLA